MTTRKIATIAVIFVLLLATIPTQVLADYSRSYTIHDTYGREMSYSISIPEDTYNHYLTQDHAVYSLNDYKRFVTPNMFENIATSIAQYAKTDLAFIQAALEIAQQIPYHTWADKLAQYPMETMVEDQGDCDDKSYVFASILLARGYYVILLHFEKAKAGGLDHMAVGVAISDFKAEYTATYWSHEGRKYYYCETTNEEWKIGQLPDDYEGMSAHILDVGGSREASCDYDGDGLNDRYEVRNYGSDPLELDTDGDGLDDYEEVKEYGTDPSEADTDGDGVDDWEEIQRGTDPLEAPSTGGGGEGGVDLFSSIFEPEILFILIIGVSCIVVVAVVAARAKSRKPPAPVEPEWGGPPPTALL